MCDLIDYKYYNLPHAIIQYIQYPILLYSRIYGFIRTQWQDMWNCEPWPKINWVPRSHDHNVRSVDSSLYCPCPPRWMLYIWSFYLLINLDSAPVYGETRPVTECPNPQTFEIRRKIFGNTRKWGNLGLNRGHGGI